MQNALQNPFMTMAARPADPVRCTSSVPTAVRVFGHGDVLAKLELELNAAVAEINADLEAPLFLRDPSPEFMSAAFMKPLIDVLNAR
jgi:hypothetical protein